MNPRTGPRGEYLLEQNLLVEASPSLAKAFPRLTSVQMDLGYFDDEGRVQNSRIKYSVNIEHAKSMFRLGCQNSECVRGDFDLTNVLTSAIMTGQTTVSGEMCCRGWRSRTVIDSVPCGKILRYTLTLSY